ncbi:hypothetical protein TSAR_015822 [Trichomalopsis sarcophagae]|uniref:Uncharacterized protein n=1 Tax=Trichomalopsis sarcophagae TaxID=543379 RepID=A0A232EKV8_9HYME|nr:hypothetical protein TSAR_015822 [Trichomalopsis sarcophagae]
MWITVKVINGCSWCYQRGLYILLVRGIRYVNEQNSIHRTNASHVKDVKITEGGTIENGVKGRSSLMELLPYFDMVWSFSFEYMHGLLLGVTNQLPRSGIIEGSAKPKASELNLPCLNGILPDRALNHFALLVKRNTNKFGSPEEVNNYCMNLFSHKRLSTYYKDGPKDITYFGRSVLVKIKEMGECLTYKKCTYKSTIYHSIKYSRAKKTDDTVVQLRSGEFGRIIDIVHTNNQCYLHLSLFHTFPTEPFSGVSYIQRVMFEETKNTFTTPITNVDNKIILLNVKNARYLCTLPNNTEIQ